MPRLIAPGLDVECKGIVFDKDGTLIDQRQAMLALGRERFRAVREVAGHRAGALWRDAVGFADAPEQIDPHGPLATAPARDEVLLAAGAVYRAGHTWLEAASLAARAYALADTRLQSPYGAVLLDGVHEALVSLRRAGFRMAVATTDRAQRTLESIAALGVEALFDAVVTVEDVRIGKPAPDMLLETCRRLDLQAHEIVMLGDTASDMRMGRAAGAARCVGVRSGMNVGAGLEDLADVILDSVAQLTPG